MKLKITQLGAIPSAFIDLSKRLTVFCGPNNTGKTYLSYILYALTHQMLKPEYVLSDDMLSSLMLNGSISFECPKDVVLSVRKRKLDYIKKNLGVIFGLPDQKADKYFQDFNIEYITTDEEHIALVREKQININLSESGKVRLEVLKLPNSMMVECKLISDEKVEMDVLREMVNLNMIYYMFHLFAFFPISISSIYPVERVSVQTFHRQLSQKHPRVIGAAEFGNGTPAGFIFEKPDRYPMAISDGLDMADKLFKMQNTLSGYADLADEIERMLLQGSLAIDKTGEAEFLANGAKSRPLPVHITASVVKSLSSIVFYLRYNANLNDAVIIDEPELNLHPDSQVLLARVFAKMLNRKLRLIISTHSDYIIRELNNLIMLSNVYGSDFDYVCKEFGYEDTMRISSDEVNAYLFKRNGRSKTNVTPIEVTKEGFDVSTIDETLHSLNKASQYLYHSIEA